MLTLLFASDRLLGSSRKRGIVWLPRAKAGLDSGFNCTFEQTAGKARKPFKRQLTWVAKLSSSVSCP